MKLFVLSCFALAAPFAFGQINNPATLALDGQPQATVFGVQGEWTVQDASTKGTSNRDLAVVISNLLNARLFLINTLNAQTPAVGEWSATRLQPGGITIVVYVPDTFVNQVRFPACDPNSQTPGTLALTLKGNPCGINGPGKLTVLRRADPWMLSGYSLAVDGFDTSKAAVEPYIWGMDASISNGVKTFTPNLGTFTFRSVSDGKSHAAGSVSHFKMKYLDAGGVIILLDGDMVIESSQPFDIYQTSEIAGTMDRTEGRVINLKASIQ